MTRVLLSFTTSESPCFARVAHIIISTTSTTFYFISLCCPASSLSTLKTFEIISVSLHIVACIIYIKLPLESLYTLWDGLAKYQLATLDSVEKRAKRLIGDPALVDVY